MMVKEVPNLYPDVRPDFCVKRGGYEHRDQTSANKVRGVFDVELGDLNK